MMRRIFVLLPIPLIAISLGIVYSTIIGEPSNKEKVEWTTDDSKSYAQDQLYEWQYKQWICLNKLWTKESNWRPDAYNKIKVMGKNAGGIPQLLGLDPTTPAPVQIDRGLAYIYNRYGTPCKAWEFFVKKGYH
jgi:hypothetical protein